MQKADENLILAAARLKDVGGGRFKDFLTALEDYRVQYADACINAPPDKVLTAQGQARSYAVLCNILQKCTETAKSIEEKQNAGGSTSGS